MIPETRYVESDGFHIAYQVTGKGATDLIVVPGFASHLEAAWDQPRYERWFRRVASYCRLILIDKRGTGLSDRVQVDNLPTLEERMQDVRAVLDAVGSERSALCGISDGGAMSALFAATYPERTVALILMGAWARAFQSPDYPWGFDPVEFQEWLEEIKEGWGTAQSVLSSAPSLADDDAFGQWYARFNRLAASPGAVAGLVRMAFEGDIRHVLPAISRPTLVLHRSDDTFVDVRHGRYLAEHIAGARFVELSGADHLFYVGDTEVADNEIELFLTGRTAGAAAQRVLATLLFTDIVDSTGLAVELGDQRWQELLEEHNMLLRHELARHDGIEVNQTGDGFLARFDGPGRAVRCAQAIHLATEGRGLQLRAGLHVGEIQLGADNISGIAVHIAQRVMASASPGETRTTGTVRDLVVGSGLGFRDLGEHELKGVPGSWKLMLVENEAGDP